LPRDLRTAQPPDQFLALAAEHAAGDDFDPAMGRGSVGTSIERLRAQGSRLRAQRLP
jgi:hypothetical protein